MRPDGPDATGRRFAYIDVEIPRKPVRNPRCINESLPSEEIRGGGAVIVFHYRFEDSLTFLLRKPGEVAPRVVDRLEIVMISVLPAGGEEFCAASAAF